MAYFLVKILLAASIAPAYAQQSVSAKEQLKLYESQVGATMKQTEECNQSNPLPHKSEIYESVLYIDDENPNKINLLSSNQKITNEQKRLLTEYLSAVNKCRRPSLSNLAAYPKVIYEIKSFNNERDIIYANLLSKKVSIGQANKSLMLVDQGFEKKLTTSMDATTKGFNDQIKNQEVLAAKEENDKQLKIEKEKKDRLAQEASEAQKNLSIIQKSEQAKQKAEQLKLAQEAKEAQKNLAIIQKSEKAKQAVEPSKKPQQPSQAHIEEERLYQVEQSRIRERQLAIQAEQVFNQTVNLCTQAAQQYQPPRSVPMPQGQMVGNQYIAPSWSQNLGAMLGNSPGGYTTNTALFESCMKARGY